MNKPLGLVAPFPVKEPEKRWTPVSCLEEFLDAVKSGTVTPDCLMIFYVQVEEDGKMRPHYWTQNCGVERQIAFAEWLKTSALDDWKDPKA